MARTSFSAPEAHIVVSTDGYFDVYPTSARTNGDKPAYRGRLAELGAGIRGADDRLAVRPDSLGPRRRRHRLVRGQRRRRARRQLGGGRDGNEAGRVKRRKVTYPGRAHPHEGRPEARGRAEVAMVRPNLAAIDLTAGAGRAEPQGRWPGPDQRHRPVRRRGGHHRAPRRRASSRRPPSAPTPAGRAASGRSTSTRSPGRADRADALDDNGRRG